MTELALIPAEEIAAKEREVGTFRVLVSIPNEGHAPVEAYANRIVNMMHLGKLEERGRLLKSNPRYEFYFFTLGRILTPLAREEAAKEALKGDFDYLYQIDDDMICPDDLFERLVRHNVDIVAPLAFSRNPPHNPVCYSCLEGWDPVAQKEYFINHVIKNYPKDELFRCDAVGFGAALIKVDVLRKMKAPYFMSTTGTGEDIFFCYNAAKFGAKIYMDSSTKLGHLSHPPNITEDYVKNYWAHIGMEAERKNGDYTKYKDERNKLLLGD